MYTDRQHRPVAGLLVAWIRRLVAMSSVIDATYPSLIALVRTAAFVPTSIGHRRRFPPRWITLWNRYCADSAHRVIRSPWLP